MSAEDLMQFATLIGGGITAVAYFPQLSKMVKHKSAMGNSLTAWYMWLLGVAAILIYAIYIKDFVLVTLHVLYFVCISLVIFLIYKYKHKKQ